jgi:putative spermidine/putrescine transport system ATP-binding protein
MTIRFEQVSYRYPGAEAGVEDIDLEIGRGELVAVVGPSGSGKSTCLKLVAGFFPPDRGWITIDGMDMGGKPPEARRVGVVFQNYALFPHMTVGENVAYPLKVRGVGKAERRAAAGAMLARVGLDGFLNRTPDSLSGGQQQRVALARALIFEPHALLLDEPLSALDAGLRVSMRDEIRRVQREAGIATLHVTHDQEEALSIADRIVVLRDGRIAQAGPPAEVYDRPASRFVASFLGQANFLDAVVLGSGEIGTALGPLHCQANGAFVPGARVTAMIRPERIDLAAADAEATPSANRFAGHIGQDRFLGAIRRFDFHVGGHVICVETRHRASPTAVAIPPEAIRLLPREDHAAGSTPYGETPS